MKHCACTGLYNHCQNTRSNDIAKRTFYGDICSKIPRNVVSNNVEWLKTTKRRSRRKNCCTYLDNFHYLSKACLDFVSNHSLVICIFLQFKKIKNYFTLIKASLSSSPNATQIHHIFRRHFSRLVRVDPT